MGAVRTVWGRRPVWSQYRTCVARGRLPPSRARCRRLGSITRMHAALLVVALGASRAAPSAVSGHSVGKVVLATLSARSGPRRLPLMGFGTELVWQDAVDSSLAAAASDAGSRVARYPGGTPSNFWDWSCEHEACCTSKSLAPPSPRCENHGYRKCPPETWANFVNDRHRSARPETIIDLNVVQTNASYQMQGLQRFAAAGVPVKWVELGNELYDPRQNQGAWTDGVGYASSMQPYLQAVAAAFPDAHTAVVGSASDAAWNAAVLTNTTATAATIHFYTALDVAGINDTTVAARAPVLLGAAFDNAARIEQHAQATIPEHLRIWVTEFGHAGTAGWATGSIDGTWLEGLYSGAAAWLLLRVSRTDVVLPYCLVCGDPNAPAFTAGPPWGATPPGNTTGEVKWELTPRGAVLSQLMTAVASHHAAFGNSGTMQELAFSAITSTSTAASVLDHELGACGTAGVASAGPLLHSERTSTSCECEAFCKSMPECQAWQWIAASQAKDHTTCYLKNIVNMVPNSESLSGVCPGTGGVCPPSPPPPLNRTILGWGFTSQPLSLDVPSSISGVVLLHLSSNPISLDLSSVLGGGAWRIATIHQPAGVAGLLRNMSTVERQEDEVPANAVVVLPPYSVVTIGRPKQR